MKLTDSSIFEFSPALMRRRLRLLGKGERPDIPDMVDDRVRGYGSNAVLMLNGVQW